MSCWLKQDFRSSSSHALLVFLGGVIGNSQSLNQYYYRTNELLHKWLNRRSQKRSYTWRALTRLLARFEVARPSIVEQGGKSIESCQLVWKFGQGLVQDLYGQPYRRARA
jgi:hypothetical protein